MLDLDRLYLRPREVASELGLTPSAIYRMAREGRIPSVKIGKSVRIPSDAFRAWRSANEGEGIPVMRLGPGAPGEPTTPDGGMSYDDRLATFERRTGRTADEFLVCWKSGELDESRENEELALEALGLRIAGLKKTEQSARQELQQQDAIAC